MPKLSIRTRLIFLFTLQIVIVFFAGGFYLDWRLRQTLEAELAVKLESLAKAVSLQIDGELLQNLDPGDEQTRTYKNLKLQLQAAKQATRVRRIYIFSKNQTSLVDTKPEITIGTEYVFLPISQTELEILFAGGTVNSTLFKGRDGRLYKTGFAPVVSNGKVKAALALEGSAETLEAIQTVRRDLLLLGIAVLVGSVMLGFLFSERITNPINRLKVAAQKIAKGDYETAMPIKGSDEIAFLGQTMEEMRRAIVQRDIRQKAMLAGVAHEIRNPLGGIELFAGLLASELEHEKGKKEAGKILKEVQNLKKIVQDFLDYARPTKPKKQYCSIKETFNQAQMLMPQELNGCTIECHEEKDGQRVWVDPQHLKQIFLNLLKNSVQAMQGSGTIRLEIVSHSHSVRLLFSDSGPGIPREIREQIFEPFFTNRKDGTGLGLAIVKSLVEENGGAVRVVEGEGAVFEIVLSKG
jgi:signal transduction histidine kinase